MNSSSISFLLRGFVLKSLIIIIQCHPLVDPSEYLEVCKKQICGNDESSNKLFCAIAGAYANTCLKKGICLEYRSAYSCQIPSCDIHSHFEECGPGCDATCDEETCLLPREPSCHCDTNLVMYKCRKIKLYRLMNRYQYNNTHIFQLSHLGYD